MKYDSLDQGSGFNIRLNEDSMVIIIMQLKLISKLFKRGFFELLFCKCFVGIETFLLIHFIEFVLMKMYGA